MIVLCHDPAEESTLPYPTPLPLNTLPLCPLLQTVAELRAQSGPHTCSTVSFSPLESLPKDLKTVRKEMNSRILARVAPCSTEHETMNTEGTGRGSRYSTVGASDSWLRGMESKCPMVSSVGRGRIAIAHSGMHREFKDTPKVDLNLNMSMSMNILARVPIGKVAGRPPRAERK